MTQTDTFVSTLQRRISVLEQDLDYYKKQYYHLKQEREWEADLSEVKQDTASVSHKATIKATVHYLRKADRDADGYAKMNAWKVGKMAGQGDQTVRDNWAFSSIQHKSIKGQNVRIKEGALHIFDKKLVKITTENFAKYPKGYYYETWMRERDLLYHPQVWQAEQPRQWGGKRIKCTNPDCGSENIQRRTILTCRDCGTVISDNKASANDEQNVESQVDIPETEGVSFFTDEQKVDLTEQPPTILQSQVDILDDPPIPITTPPIPVEDFLQQRIGHGRMIVSTGKLETAKKYYTEEPEYVPDIAAYLRGDLKHIYGSRPALPDGTTYLLGFDIETPELDKSHKYMMFRLALAGIASVYWKRRPGRGHLEPYTSAPVDRKAFYAHCVRVCPDLAAVPEVFPIGSDQNTNGDDRSDYGYSWPLFYRIDDQVIECEAEFCFPDRPGELVTSSGYLSDRAGLTHLLSRAIMDATLIPAFKEKPQIPQAQPDVLLLEKPSDRSIREGDDLKPVVLDEWNRTHSWDYVINLCGGVQKNKHFLAVWRPERTASVKVDPDGRYACDYGKHGAFPKKLDKFGVYCLAQGLDQAQEINRLCADYRQLSRQERRAS